MNIIDVINEPGPWQSYRVHLSYDQSYCLGIIIRCDYARLDRVQLVQSTLQSKSSRCIRTPPPINNLHCIHFFYTSSMVSSRESVRLVLLMLPRVSTRGETSEDYGNTQGPDCVCFLPSSLLQRYTLLCRDDVFGRNAVPSEGC